MKRTLGHVLSFESDYSDKLILELDNIEVRDKQ